MELLNILSNEKFVSGQKIADILSISRSAVHKRIQKLRRRGYKIQGEQNLGYTLISKPDALFAEEIELYFEPGNPAVNKILYFPQIDSTQIIAKDLGSKGEDEFTLLVAEKQDCGYGRLKRNWSSPEGGIWFSLILRPLLPPDRIPQLTFVMSLSICKTIERMFKVSPKIKWPNDVMLSGRKLCGILTEMSAEVGRTNWVVLGVGLNANNTLPVFLKKVAISLKSELGLAVNRPSLLSTILTNFKKSYAEFCKKGFGIFKPEYNKRSFLAHKKIKVNTGERTIQGLFKGIDGDGYLLLQLNSGATEKIVFGDVSVMR